MCLKNNAIIIINFAIWNSCMISSKKWCTQGLPKNILMQEEHSKEKVLPVSVDTDFGAGSKLLRGVVTLEDIGGATRPAPLGASLEGRGAFRAGWSSFPKLEPVGGRQ